MSRYTPARVFGCVTLFVAMPATLIYAAGNKDAGLFFASLASFVVILTPLSIWLDGRHE